MLGKTHMAVGVGSALLIVPPQNLPELAVGISTAAAGSLIPDIDVKTSQAHRAAEKVIWIGILAAGIIMITDYFWFPVLNKGVMTDSTVMRMLAAAAVLFGICAIGKSLPHRSFMHSILAMLILTACVGVFLPIAAPWFLIAFLSHLTIDVFNRKGEQLLYPLHKRYCLRLCSSKGLVNGWMFWIGAAVSAGMIAFTVLRTVDGIL